MSSIPYDPEIVDIKTEISSEGKEGYIKQLPEAIRTIQNIIDSLPQDYGKNNISGIIKINSDVKLLDAIDSLNEANKLAKDAFDSCKSVDGESNYPIKNTGRINQVLINQIKSAHKATTCSELIPINKNLENLLFTLYNLLYGCYDTLVNIHAWIQLQIPAVKEGYSFTVDIQQDIIGQCGEVEDTTTNTLENLLSVFTNRGALVQNLLCTSEVEDYHKRMLDFDNKQIIEIRANLLDLRNKYTVFHDLVTKNYNKIVNPTLLFNKDEDAVEEEDGEDNDDEIVVDSAVDMEEV